MVKRQRHFALARSRKAPLPWMGPSAAGGSAYSAWYGDLEKKIQTNKNNVYAKI